MELKLENNLAHQTMPVDGVALSSYSRCQDGDGYRQDIRLYPNHV